jgi:hypothetical protein
LADGKQEKARRKLWLANERLRTGYELVQAGDEASGIEILTKAQAYLQGAYELGEPSEQWGKELAWSAEKHEQVLQVIEPEVGEVLRPRVTELLDRCRLVSSESAGMR